MMDTPHTLLQPIWTAEPGRWDFAMAAHLYRRAGFGATIDEIDQAVAAGPLQTVNLLCDYATIQNDLPPMEFGELTGPLDARKKAGGLGRAANRNNPYLKDLSQDQKKVLYNLEQGAQRVKLEELKLWWIDRMIRTKRPLEEKMTLFWHGLFVSSSLTVKNSFLLAKQNDLFRDNATGNYKSLALAVSKDPCMLLYLNNNENVKAHPNENYARELMELFTLGIGNYTEKDIKESARSFTGWTNLGDQFIFNRNQHDNGTKTFLGQTGNFTGEDIVDIIFQQPACAVYIANRLIKFFGTDEPDAPLVAAIASLVRQSNFEVRPVLHAMFASNWFYSPEVMERQIKSPVQLVVGSLRALNVGLAQPKQVDSALKIMGQELFGAPTVKGWDGGRAWINTSTLFARYNLPAYLGTGKLPNAGKKAAGGNAMDMAMQYQDFDSGWSPQEDLAAAGVSTTDGVVDLYTRKLLGTTLDPMKREDLLQYMNASGDTKSHLNDPIDPNADNRVRSLVHLIMSMAEYQLA